MLCNLCESANKEKKSFLNSHSAFDHYGVYVIYKLFKLDAKYNNHDKMKLQL